MKLDLQLKIGLFFAFTLLAAGGGILTLSRLAMDAQTHLAQTTLQANTRIQTASGQAIDSLQKTAGQGMEHVFLVADLQAAFLDQMFQWKNYLVRGEFKDMREKYLTIITDGDRRITTMLGEVQKVFRADPEGLKLLTQITGEYKNFQKQAEVARGMMAFSDTYAEGIRSADQYTGDHGVATIGLIRKLARHAAERMEKELSTTAETTLHQARDTASAAQAEVKGQQQGIRHQSLLVSMEVGSGLSLVIVVALFFLQRTVINPVMEINERLQSVVKSIAGEAAQLLDVSTSLAAGAGQQSAELEETGASIEELASQASANSESARQVSSFSASAQQVVSTGVAQMAKMIDAMQEIGKSSTEVIKITKNIDEIAFQTNLLALNAAVEAARAGQAGAGFSVVADEIRELSRKVAASAKDAEAISKNASAKVRQGSQLCEDLENALAKITQEIGQVDTEVKGIAVASSEQARGVTQVNTAISEIDRVSCTAAVQADEAAKMAEALQAQAMELGAISATLVRLVKNRPSPSAQSAPPPSLPPGLELAVATYET